MKILFLAPHLSTGGMPAFLLKRIEVLQQYTDYEIFVVEYKCISMEYTVQRTKIIKLIGSKNFITLNEDKNYLLRIIGEFQPDIIHIDEMSERLDSEMIKKLYNPDRSYKIIETCHDISFNPQDKIYTPDAYAFCTPYHLKTFIKNSGYKKVIEFPIDKKEISNVLKEQSRLYLGMEPYIKQVINVGLWTPGKNQAEAIEIARNYPNVMFHFIGNQAENFRTYWEPLMQNLPDNVKVWGERDDISIFMQAADVFMFNSTWECNPLVLKEAISYGLPIIAKDLPQYKGMYDGYIAQSVDLNSPIISKLMKYSIPKDNTSKDFALNHINLYKHLLEEDEYKIISHFINGPFVEITGKSKSDFRVEFWDEDTLIHYDTIKTNHWVRANRKYYTKWTIKIYKDDKLCYINILNFSDKIVYIAFDSSSLGDTIAWIPYIEEFRKKHNCHVIVSTYKNFLFKDVYPKIEFVKPETIVNNIFGMYTIGWFYDSNKEPVLPNTIPLQQTAANILGLEYKEIKPNIIKPIFPTHSRNKTITIATNSTSGCKFWTREAWQEVIDYLYLQDYEIINTSLEENPFKNCNVLTDKSIENTINCIGDSEFFIGLSSGLSWLAWALDKEVIMISNFTNEEHEFKCQRPVVKSVCNSCWNNPNFKFDKGDWEWCPIHKGTERQFECQKAITSQMVIELCDKLINLKSSS